MSSNDVLDFINRRFAVNCDWMTSNSYWFAKILSLRFTSLHVYYDPNNAHFVAADSSSDVYFDYEGEHKINNNIINVDNMLYEQPIMYIQLMKLHKE